MILSSTNNISNKFDQLDDKLFEIKDKKTPTVAKRILDKTSSVIGATLSGTSKVLDKVLTPRNVLLGTVLVGAQQVMSGPISYASCIASCYAGVTITNSWPIAAWCATVCAPMLNPLLP